MPAAITVAAGSAWSVGASILTFAFPMILFLAVASALFVAYTKPSVVPGHREQTVARPIGYTPAVRLPSRDQAVTGQVPAGPHHVTGPAHVQARDTPPAPDHPHAPDHPAAPDDPAAGPGATEGAR